ncbi:hypothetical protein BT094_10540 [Corynebacterium diphtheriae]|nr:RhuM family protein [Corynebacterium diphtheriae]PSA79924.1 hypothetical protein BT094_10540 [Corynebacterium diphtheriae]
MILAVGYQVRGVRGTQFRKWATEVLSEYLTKGFALDDQRPKNDGVDTHFDELFERIREITDFRASILPQNLRRHCCYQCEGVRCFVCEALIQKEFH